MRKFLYILTSVLLFIQLTACSSVDSDARKAAELNKKSMESIKQQDLQKAADLYKEVQDIFARYKGTEDYDKFHIAYNRYLLGEEENP